MNLYLKFLLPIVEVFSIGLFLQGYFQVTSTFDDINRIKSSNDNPMKVILLLVDALRIDLFTNLTFYQEMKSKQEEYQILYYGIANSPAVTQLNLKAITTGNFPAFIDFGSNMAAQELNFDNIISSMKRSKKKLALLGDETWSYMFPSQFDFKFTSESFDVRDLDSDDNIVINNMFNLIDDNYDFIVGHLLGIDHSGHSYNDSNQALWNKQKQYSDFLFQIYNNMDNDTILFVIGDHGMSEDGNHGGGTPKEISSTIYSINKKYKFNKGSFNQDRKIIENPIMEKKQYIRQIYNIDIAPTISYLMGISMPFSNIGAILIEMISSKQQQEQGCKENYYQIKEYLIKFKQFESSLNDDIDIYQSSDQSDCQSIVESIYDLQMNIKQNKQTYDYFNIITSLLLMVTLFAFQVTKISETLFNKQFIGKNNFLFSRLEKYPLLIFIIVLMFIQVTYAIKAFAVYILILLLKKLLQPLFAMEKIKTIIHKIIHPLPYYRRYFFMLVNLVVQKGFQELSADRQIIYTANIFGIFINVIVMLLISQCKLLLKHSYLILIVMFLMLISEQYNITFETTKPQSPFILNYIGFLFQSFWIKYFVPAILLQRIIFRLEKNIAFSVLLTIAQLVSIFNNSVSFHVVVSDILQNQIWIFTRFLPLSLFILSAILILQQKDLLFFLPIVIAISGKQGIFMYCCLIYSIFYMFKFLSKIENAWFPPFAGGICCIFLNYFWLTLGHRMSFSNVKFQDALIGSETYDVVFNTTLLIISIYGIFCSTEIIRRIIQYLWNGGYFRKCKMMKQEFENKTIEFLIVIQFSQIIFTSIHSALNLYHQNIIDLFAQKIIYEAIIFAVLVLFNLLNDVLKIFNQWWQKIQKQPITYQAIKKDVYHVVGQKL